MFNNTYWIAIAVVLIAVLYFGNKRENEREHTKQLELQLKIAQLSLVSTNHVER